MSIKFNFDSKDFEKKIRQITNEKLAKGFEVDCPNCGHKTKLNNARSIPCPKCGTSLILDGGV